ncbi:MAG: primosomal protein N', partial [Bdellovibrionaceae bacterium]|nr:primosomal protein N' [Pseudobdellovibrionaceae bacterium]
TRVQVPLGPRTVWEVDLRQAEVSPAQNKEIIQVDQTHPNLPEPYLKWLEWLSDYYLYPIGQTIQSVWPPLNKSTRPRKSKKSPIVPTTVIGPGPELTPEQLEAYSAIAKSQDFSVHLLHGVTGSGKTEVYLRLFADLIAKGKQGLFLVPEISLTPQLIQRFAARFGEQIAVLHSQLTERERTDQWWSIVDGKKSILIGARSALFCPIPNLGLIVVDEEHEPSYKQEEKLKYHGRDAAIMLGKLTNSPVVLGSATPSLETWKNTLDGKYAKHTLSKRVADQPLPKIEIIDLRSVTSKRDPNHPFWLTRDLHEALDQTFSSGFQAALFLNRRGIAQSVICPACGYTVECPNCDINLTLHGKSDLVCHYCNYHETLRAKCPDCKEGELLSLGLGTELLEKDLQKVFADIRIARADRDEIQNREEMSELIQRMENREIDLLIGTQMIAKGLDFPGLKLVGLVLADVGFNVPDFRATERSFQLITQMSGRAGRHTDPTGSASRVIVQTFNPNHPSLVFASNHDFEGFSQQELRARALFGYPPFGRLINLRVLGPEASLVEGAASKLAKRSQLLKNFKSPIYSEVEIVGPSQAPIFKLRNTFRYQLLLKGIKPQTLNHFVRQLLSDQSWLPRRVRVVIDVDPYSSL